MQFDGNLHETERDSDDRGGSSWTSFGAEGVRARRWLITRLQQVARRVRWLLWIRAAALCVLMVLGILGTAAILDWWLRPTSVWGRGVLTGLTWAAIALAVGHLVRVVWWRPISVMAVARRLEAGTPGLGDRLSSALALVERAEAKRAETGIAGGNEPSGGIGSGELADTVVRQVAEEYRRAEPERRVDRGPTVRMVSFAGVALAVVLASYFWNPAVASMAARRMVDLRSETQWPRQVVLELVDLPARMHAGDDLEVMVANRLGELPADTEIQVRFSDRTTEARPAGMAGAMGVATWQDVRASLSVRAVGGDDDTMEWQPVEVVDAPQVESHEFRLLPPDYTGREEVRSRENRLRVLAGTRMWLDVAVSRPLAEVRLRCETAGGASEATTSSAMTTASEATAASNVLPMRMVDAGAAGMGGWGQRWLVGPVTLEQTLRGRLEWIDQEGLSGESLWEMEIRVEPDRPPQVVLLSPDQDQSVTAEASVQLDAGWEDDLGIVRGWFELRHVASGAVAELEVGDWIDQPLQGREERAVRIDDWLGMAAETAVTLAEGDVLEIRALGLDVAGQQGSSVTRRLQIVSREEVQRLVDGARGEALEQIREAETQQTESRQQTEAAQRRLGESDAQQQRTADRLRAAMSMQRAAAEALDGERESAVETLRRAEAMAAANGLDPGELADLRESLEEVAGESVSEASAALEAAARELSAGDTEATAEKLEAAVREQMDAESRLQAMTERLEGQDRRRVLASALLELETAQQRARTQTRQLDEVVDRNAEQRRLGNQQRGIARETEALANELNELAESLSETEPEAAEAARRAAESLQGGEETASDASAAETMRRAAEALERDRVGEAERLQTESQQRVERARRELQGTTRDEVSGDEPTEAAAEEAWLSQVTAVAQEQRGLLGVWEQTGAAELARRQLATAVRTTELADQPAAPPGFGDVLRDAEADMQLAAQWLQRGSSDGPAFAAARGAAERLELIVQSLQAAESERGEQGGENTEPPEENAAPPSGIPLSSLRLARELQSYLKNRTIALADEMERAEAAGGDPVLRARLRAERAKLAAEQQRLVERIERYAREWSEAGAASAAGQSEDAAEPTGTPEPGDAP